MNHRELSELFDKVTTDIYDYSSYHVWYNYGNEYWAQDNSYVTFEVYGHSDQGEGADWTEYWSINSDGWIYTDDNVYKTYEDFKNKWG